MASYKEELAQMHLFLNVSSQMAVLLPSLVQFSHGFLKRDYSLLRMEIQSSFIEMHLWQGTSLSISILLFRILPHLLMGYLQKEL